MTIKQDTWTNHCIVFPYYIFQSFKRLILYKCNYFYFFKAIFLTGLKSMFPYKLFKGVVNYASPLLYYCACRHTTEKTTHSPVP